MVRICLWYTNRWLLLLYHVRLFQWNAMLFLQMFTQIARRRGFLIFFDFFLLETMHTIDVFCIGERIAFQCTEMLPNTTRRFFAAILHDFQIRSVFCYLHCWNIITIVHWITTRCHCSAHIHSYNVCIWKFCIDCVATVCLFCTKPWAKSQKFLDFAKEQRVLFHQIINKIIFTT